MTMKSMLRTTSRFLWIGLVAALAVAWIVQPALSADKVKFMTNWKAQAEHGGFYQAIATGIYKKKGLDVTLRMGGPGANNPQLLAGGAIDINLSTNTGMALNFLKNNVPMITVAAIFQKDPQVLISHPGQGNDTIPAMKGKPIMISTAARNTWWIYFRQKYGFKDNQIRRYTFQMAPFLVDKKAIQQGYVSSEPFYIKKEGVNPIVNLIADTGWPAYSALLTTSKDWVDNKTDVVRKFVEGSIEGWYSYLFKNPAPANKLIQKDNKEMSSAQIVYGISKLKEHGIVDGADAKRLGIGTMTEPRIKEFFELMSNAGLYDKNMKYMKAFDLRFVNKKHGMM